MSMGKIIYDFGDGRTRAHKTNRVALALALAVARFGSDKAVCAALGVSRNVLARWRTGAGPRQANLQALAGAAEIPVEWFTEVD